MNIKKASICVLSLILFGMGSSLYSDTISEKAKEHLEKVKDSIPGIGLIANEINYDGLKITDFQFDTEKKYTIVHPNETVRGEMSYEIDTSKLENISLHHFIYGLYPDGPIDCLVHSIGVVNSSGRASIYFNAPEQKGVYQLRLCHCEGGFSCSRASDTWYEGNNPPNNTIMGIVVVE